MYVHVDNYRQKENPNVPDVRNISYILWYNISLFYNSVVIFLGIILLKKEIFLSSDACEKILFLYEIYFMF